MGEVEFWLADPDLSRDQACGRLGIRPDQADDMADFTHSSVQRIPASFPKVAGYTTGTPDIAWTAADWERFKGAKVPIDQSNSSILGGAVHWAVEDVEQSAVTPAAAAEGARRELAATGGRNNPTIYCPGSLLEPCKAACRALGLTVGRLVAVQWAWPSTNPHTLLPGSKLTLSQVNADLSVTLPSWHPVPRKHRPIPKPPKPPAHVTIPATGGGLGTALVAVLHSSGVSVTPTEGAAIGAFIPTLLGLLKAFANGRKK